MALKSYKNLTYWSWCINNVAILHLSKQDIYS